MLLMIYILTCITLRTLNYEDMVDSLLWVFNAGFISSAVRRQVTLDPEVHVSTPQGLYTSKPQMTYVPFSFMCIKKC